MLALTALSAACSTAPSSPPCIRPIPYNRESQTKVAGELRALPPGAELRRYMDDYAAARAAMRAACGIPAPRK